MLKDLLWQIPIFSMAGAMAYRLIIAPYELWREAQERASDATMDPSHSAYLEEQGRQRAITEAESARARRNNPFFGGSLQAAFEKVEKDRQAADEAARQRLIAGASKPKPPVWLPLHKALRYLVYDSQWGHTQALPVDERAFDTLVSEEFIEAMARGEVSSRGKKGKNFAQERRTTEPIPADYWITAFVQPHGEIVLADNKRGATGRPAQNETFMQVVVNEAELKRRWPSANQDIPSQLAATCEPLRAQIEQEKNQ